ncbi:serine hydroxymethyltransferase [Olsenella sp. HMSC062G07]|uniref:serine hydroxymethyltransferase n=1 Tax=Olsenella sp. HMSC062G07 TaxID=1739330 RepID=UPI0008A19FA9|nr:serine hydroxymethyltransferase [Olsenella sp. HMSC062G07]OFK22159.1 serine hydroxymethyltransferase [Olsenella sp. HMSC062G07]
MTDYLAGLRAQDPAVAELVGEELARQRDSIELIASENFVSPAVMQAVGTPLTNKYAEGLPGKRYYGGCWAVDKVENLAIDRVKQLFGCNFANVQPHSGAQANYAAESAFAKPGDTIMGMDLSNGGHLTHGSPANFSGKLFDVQSYGLDPDTERINYDEVAERAQRCHPAIIIAGASAYPRLIDFERFAKIAHDSGAILMVDMAHIAGIVAVGLHPSPIPFADVVTSTTHKTLRGTRGGIILWNDPAYSRRLNSAVFPGSQGGPLEHVIAGKAVAFAEALRPEFKTYIGQVLINAKALGRGMESRGIRLVTGGTDNHLVLADLTKVADGQVSGKDAEQALERVGITVNKNTIPGERRSPFVTSGIRVGSAAATTRGFGEQDCERIGELIGDVVAHINDERVLDRAEAEVKELLAPHPLYPELG